MLASMARIAVATMTVLAGAVAGTPDAAGAVDTIPPSVPQNVRISGQVRNQAVISWAPSTDDSGSIRHYWVSVDSQQRAKPTATTYAIDTLVQLCRITPGAHTITIVAVDPSLNRSAPSKSINITVQ